MDKYTVVKDSEGYSVLDENKVVVQALNGNGYVEHRDRETAEMVAAYLNEATREVPESEKVTKKMVAMDLGKNGDLILTFWDDSVLLCGETHSRFIGNECFRKDYHCWDELAKERKESLPEYTYGSSPIGHCPEHADVPEHVRRLKILERDRREKARRRQWEQVSEDETI